MIAAAGTGMPPVQHEFLGAEPALARFFVERGRIRDQLGPVARGMDVDLDHAGIGCYVEPVDPADREGGV